MKKKLFLFLSVCSITFSFSACGGISGSTATSEIPELDDLLEPISSATYTSEEATNEASSDTTSPDDAYIENPSEDTSAVNSSEDTSAENSSEDTSVENSSEDTSVENSSEDTSAENSSEDTSAEENPAELTGEFAFDLPEGFHQSMELSTIPSTIYYVSDNSELTSNISVVTVPNDGSFYDITADMFAASLQSQFESLGHTVYVTVLSKEYYEINARQVYQYSLEYVLNDITVQNGQCIIENGDELIYISYATNPDEGLTEALEACLDSVRFE